MNEITTPIQITNTPDGLRVESTTIAEGTGVQHKNVLELIETHRAALEEFGQLAFETRPGYNNAPVRIAMLNEPQATLLMTLSRNLGRVVEFKVALVKAFFDMAQQLAQRNLPSRADLAKWVLEAEAKTSALEAKVAEDAPKVLYVDSFVADNDTHLFRTVASNLEVSEGDLRAALKFAGWIYRQEQRRRNSKGKVITEYQWCEYATKKPFFFRKAAHENAPLFKGSVAFTLTITPAGAAAITEFVERLASEHGSLRNALPTLQEKYNDRQERLRKECA
ncbi:Rha family transcriptional regulator [Arthrobacter woluwensis]|uniref:Phage regulatory protein Rha (Phage_pRha) n=1 Tax=Arthrobacter woluwensis TaxID=156980 RepID=A0A1H4I4A0_9MICC|nr:Rha family transcriptional regulator [Arthrobacter woluwensis]SEB28919.1 Phage regulatory protein Rha (Phage_pRha) [Arthrobacter woluwensis]SEC52864.1 Phage regulatory protein Rha (Phage_pRha) [Arthrobacter woluwensis]